MCVCVQENIYIYICVCAYTGYEVSQDFYVGHKQQLKRITVLGILRSNYIRYKKLHNYINNHCKKVLHLSDSFKW